jgi:tRNA (guanine-N7-)-methyltransferase
MPHIAVKNFKEFQTPKSVGEFEFLWFAKPLKKAKKILVGVKRDKEQFLLEIFKKGDKFLIKSNKHTRISPLFLVKRALKSFCEIGSCEVLYDNLSTIRPSHSSKAQGYLKDISYFIDNFPKEKEIWIEIGFGSARHLLYQAKKNPDIQFIGIEIHKPSIEQALKQIAIRNLNNLYIIDYDARLFLEFVPSNRVGRIFIHFPVPWDKKPHRRVFSKSFINEAKRILKKDGILELRTDSKAYFDYSLELFLELDSVKLEIDKNFQKEISSKYEDRWVRYGKDIYDLRMINQEESKDIDIGFDFEFKKLRFNDKIVTGFDDKPKVFKDYFIHFEKLYKISDNTLLLELSFGSFNRPEHKYILIKESGANYFPKRPVASLANIKAHKKIEEMLNGKECNNS